MSQIEAFSATLDFPVYGIAARDIRSHMLKTMKVGSMPQYRDSVVVRALSNINFKARAGDKVALLGRNGAGKSTLLRLLAGIYEPSSGQLTRKGNIRTLLDINSGMEEDASGRSNIILRARYMGASPKQARDLVDEVVEFAELDEFIDLPIRTYSAGMRVRLSFAVSTSFEADILLIDEILGAGDAGFITKAFTRMERIIANSGLVILATHSLSLSDTIANRGIVLSGGKITFDGDYKEAVADYLASIDATT